MPVFVKLSMALRQSQAAQIQPWVSADVIYRIVDLNIGF